MNRQEATLQSLESGATVQRAYLGGEQDLHTGAHPVVGRFDLLGGSTVGMEIVAKSGQPLDVELWQIHVDDDATLALTIDEPSGFTLDQVQAPEDSSWLLRFPAGAPEDIVVDIECLGGTHGCTPFQQPGEACPEGWRCDEGLVCKVPGDVCAVP